MKDMELRFVERHWEIFGEKSILKILQYRKFINHGDFGYWTEWVDVPTESE